MRFNLVENAKDSLDHAIENIIDKSRSRDGCLKRVIQNLSHAVELVLKERLIREHPAFVYTKIDQYPTSDALTVSTDLAVQRLERLSGLTLDDDDKKTIENSRKKRNVIEHFEFDIPTKEAEVIIGRLLSFILRFSKEHLNLDWQSKLLTNPCWPELKKYSDFWDVHSQKVLDRMYNLDFDECPVCLLGSFDMEELQCQLCGHKDSYIECTGCKEEFLESLGEEVGNYELCPGCVRADAAAFNHEKY